MYSPFMTLKKICSRRQVLVGCLIVLCIGLAKFFRINDFFSITYIHQHLQFLHQYIEQQYFLAVLLYMVSYIIAAAIALPGSTGFLIVAGLLFGTFPGCIYASIAATIGSTLLFLTSRYLIGNWVQENYATHLRKFNEEIDRYGTVYLFMVRVVALFPFFLVNLLSGITLMPTRSFMIATAFGIIPGSLIFGHAGNALSKLDSISTFFEPPILFAFGICILFKIILMPLVYIHFKKRA